MMDNPASLGSAPLLEERRPPASPRIAWVDTAKGYGIALVVLGHAILGLLNGGVMGRGRAVDFAVDAIYAFHMPLFFFLSGLFIRRSAGRPWGEFGLDRLRTIAYPYLVWSLISVVIKAGLGSAVTRPRGLAEMGRILIQPIEQFWFLYALFFLVLAVGALLKLGASPWLIAAAAAIAYPGVLPVSGSSWGPLDQIRQFAIYVAAGTLFESLGAASGLVSARSAWLGLLATAGLLVVAAAAGTGLTSQPAVRPALAASGTAAVLALAVLTDRVGAGRAVGGLGRYSLEIFVAHTIASASTRIGLLKVARVADPTTHLILGTAAGLLVPIALAVGLGRIGFRYGFTLPRPPKGSAGARLADSPVGSSPSGVVRGIGEATLRQPR